VTIEPSEYVCEPLDQRHDRAAFSSGVEPLDRYLQVQAGQDMRRHLASVFVLVPADTTKIVGYYTLSASAIALTELPRDVTKGLPRYPFLPATLIGRLAVDQGYRGRHLGEKLLSDALSRSLRSEIASMMVVVDAKDAAARAFYERYGFRLLPDQETTRLFITMKAISRSISSRDVL